MIVEKILYHERKTWIKGILTAKAKSKQSKSEVDGEKNLDYINSKVLSSKIVLEQSLEKLKSKQNSIEKKHRNSKINCGLALPKKLRSSVSAENGEESFKLELHDLRFTKEPKISKVLIEDEYSFATYQGEVIGYTLDVVKNIELIEVEEPELSDTIEKVPEENISDVVEKTKIKNGGHIKGKVHNVDKYWLKIKNGGNPNEIVSIDGVEYHTPKEIQLKEGTHSVRLSSNFFKLNRKSYFFKQWSDGSASSSRSVKLDQNKELQPLYKRYSTETNNRRTPPGCLESIREVISLLLSIALLIMALFSLRFLWPFALIIGLIYLISHFWTSRIWGMIIAGFRVLGLLFFIGLVGFAISNFFNSYTYNWVEAQNDNPTEVKRQELRKNTKSNSIEFVDTLAVQHREWKDYDGNFYEIDLKMRTRDINNAKDNRNSFGRINSIRDYNNLYFSILEHDKTQHFDLIYAQLDSIRLVKELNKVQFAKMLVSMIQDITYVLILDGDCDWRQTRSMAVKDMLDKGIPCDPNVNGGIYSPIEFLSNLKGDCDTRTLTLFKILKHYKYDVRILNSEEVGHSILGINQKGLYGQGLIFDKKKYITWETTAKGIKPGFRLPNIQQNLWKTAIY